MMLLVRRPLSLGIGVVLLTTLAGAAQGPGTGRMMRMYNPDTETSIKGIVQEVKQATCGRMMGTHVVLKSRDESREVMLGPSTFITSKGFAFAKGDSLEVTGSKVTVNGINYIIAREVVKDGKTLTLRDKSGKPQWSGMGMGVGPCPAMN
jgi:hypothetical protein